MHKISQPIAATATYIGSLTDSQRWSSFEPRYGDIVVATPPKSGTTWTQAILALLISGDPEVDAKPSVNGPWLDNRLGDLDEVLARLDGQTHRRQIKTHTPFDGIPYWDELRYISIYRHPIDVHFSARKHLFNYKPDVAEQMGLRLDRFPDDPRESFRIFIELDEFEDLGSLKGIAKHFLMCRARASRENLLQLHYADMTRDLPAHVRKIAAHVGIEHSDDLLAKLTEAAHFKNMKANSERFALAAGKGVWRDESGFFDSATSNKWEGVLTDDDLAAYDKAISRLMDVEERRWLEWGTQR